VDSFLSGVDEASLTGLLRLVGFDLSDREQRQAEVAHSGEQAMQGCLIDDRAMDEGGAVAVAGEGQPVKPGRPSGGRDDP
jgi:hypothetical protein